MKNRIKKIMALIAAFVIAFTSLPAFGGGLEAHAAGIKAPGQVTKLSVTDKSIGELIPFADIFKPRDQRRVVGISRDIWLKWKKVNGATGYRIYLSTTSAKKGYKLVKTINSNYGWKGYIDSGMISYRGAKNAQAWVKVYAFKKSGKKVKLGKASKVLKVVLLQEPKITSVKGTGNKVSIKWNKVAGAKNYEVLISTAEDMSAYREKYNKKAKYPLPAKAPKSFLATAKKVATTKGNTSSFTLPKEGNYFIQVRAINGKEKSEIDYNYSYYDWWTE